MMAPVKEAHGVEDLYEYLGIDAATYKEMTVDAQRAIAEIYSEFTRWSTREKCEYFIPLSDDEKKVIVERYAARIWDEDGNPLLYQPADDDDWKPVTWERYLQDYLDTQLLDELQLVEFETIVNHDVLIQTDVIHVRTGVKLSVFRQLVPSFDRRINWGYYINYDNFGYVQILSAIDQLRR